MAQAHSRIASAAYQDLLRLTLDADAAGVVGTIVERKVRERTYLYENTRIGDRMHSRYIGEATPDLRDRLMRNAQLKTTEAERAGERSRLVRLLRAEGLKTTDSATGALLSAFARAGVFRLGGTIVGTAAYGFYEGDLGVRWPLDETAMTADIDFASFTRLSLALEDKVTEPLPGLLGALRFDPLPAVDNRHVWRWRQTQRQTLVEFLTPAFGDETLRALPALGVSAQGLNYLNFLIAEPMQAVALYRSGVLVQVPRPERYAIHKLIIADRRRQRDSLKANKDRAQADFLIRVLAEDRPDDLRDAWDDARGRGPRWRERMDATLTRMPATQALLAAAGCVA